MRSLFALLFPPSILILSAAPSSQLGAVLRERKITEATGFPGDLNRLDVFGCALDRIGDLNGDGVMDLAVGAYGDNRTHGALWIAFLKPDGSVNAATKISRTTGGSSLFGERVAGLGDLDGDGAGEVAVIARNPRRVLILLLNPDGTVRAEQALLATDPAFGGLAFEGEFEAGGLSPVGDVDGDGVPDLAWGAPADNGWGAGPGAVWIVRLNPDGTAKAATRITSGESGFTATLESDAGFGSGICQLGDVNGDGRPDLGVLDYKFYREGARFWVLFLGADGQVLGHRVTTGAELDFSFIDRFGNPAGSYLGWDADAVGDLDGDGIQEVAVSLRNYRDKGGLSVFFLARDGSVRKRLNLGEGENGLAVDPNRPNGGGFAMALSSLGDLDGDGTPELAAGNASDSTTEPGAGAFSILSLDADAVRNGSGVNPLTLKEKSEPSLGRQWKLALDCAAHSASGVAFVQGRTRPLPGVPLSAGELLIDPASPRLFQLVAPHGGGASLFSLSVPNDVALVSLQMHLQGLCTGAPGAQLSNAIDSQFGR